MSLIAPSDGATVQVPLIFVYGTVQPANAIVLVDGKRIPVLHGTFKQPYRLSRRLTRISLVAQAHGYVRQQMELHVGYQPRRHAVTPLSPPEGSNPGASYFGPGSGGGSYTGLEAGFVAACANSTGSVSFCQCAWRHIAKAGYGNEASLTSLAMNLRRSFLATGTITYPRAFRDAIFACASALQSG
jgi:hypothetical protein